MNKLQFFQGPRLIVRSKGRSKGKRFCSMIEHRFLVWFFVCVGFWRTKCVAGATSSPACWTNTSRWCANCGGSRARAKSKTWPAPRTTTSTTLTTSTATTTTATTTTPIDCYQSIPATPSRLPPATGPTPTPTPPPTTTTRCPVRKKSEPRKRISVETDTNNNGNGREEIESCRRIRSSFTISSSNELQIARHLAFRLVSFPPGGRVWKSEKFSSFFLSLGEKKENRFQVRWDPRCFSFLIYGSVFFPLPPSPPPEFGKSPSCVDVYVVGPPCDFLRLFLFGLH